MGPSVPFSPIFSSGATVNDLIIKICGMREQADLDCAAALGVNLCGFIFAPHSPRAVTPEQAAALDSETVCSRHGPVLQKEQLGDVLAAYDTWSAYRPETEGVLVAYSSIYGHTAEAANRLAEALREKGVETVAMDLARCDMAEAVAQAFRFSKLVLATPTYNADVFPFMKEFIHHLTERNYQNRTVAFIENGSWAPMAAKVMTKMLEGSKNLTYAATTVTVRGALNAASEAQLAALADELSR